MNVPALHDLNEAGVHDWDGSIAPLEAAARAAKLKFIIVNFSAVKSKHGLLEAFYRDLQLPGHFGRNWDAVGDCLVDEDWASAPGYVIVWKDSGKFQHEHHDEFETAWEIFADAAQFWTEHKKPFWVFAA